MSKPLVLAFHIRCSRFHFLSIPEISKLIPPFPTGNLAPYAINKTGQCHIALLLTTRFQYTLYFYLKQCKRDTGQDRISRFSHLYTPYIIPKYLPYIKIRVLKSFPRGNFKQQNNGSTTFRFSQCSQGNQTIP